MKEIDALVKARAKFDEGLIKDADKDLTKNINYSTACWSEQYFPDDVIEQICQNFDITLNEEEKARAKPQLELAMAAFFSQCVNPQAFPKNIKNKEYIDLIERILARIENANIAYYHKKEYLSEDLLPFINKMYKFILNDKGKLVEYINYLEGLIKDIHGNNFEELVDDFFTKQKKRYSWDEGENRQKETKISQLFSVNSPKLEQALQLIYQLRIDLHDNRLSKYFRDILKQAVDHIKDNEITEQLFILLNQISALLQAVLSMFNFETPLYGLGFKQDGKNIQPGTNPGLLLRKDFISACVTFYRDVLGKSPRANFIHDDKHGFQTRDKDELSYFVQFMIHTFKNHSLVNLGIYKQHFHNQNEKTKNFAEKEKHIKKSITIALKENSITA